MGKYDALDTWFTQIQGDEVTVALDDLASTTGIGFPPSARQHSAWWSGSQPHARWTALGWTAHPQLDRGLIQFTRKRGSPMALPFAEPVRAAAPPRATAGDLILLGCVKSKRNGRSAAKDLYDSALWRGRRAYAEASGKPWAILSAKHGLVMPDDLLDPYELHLASLSVEQIREWNRQVAIAVLDLAGSLGAKAAEVHAGSEYVDYGLGAALQSAGLTVVRPLLGVPLGRQLAWYGSRELEPEPTVPTSSTLAADLAETYASGVLGGTWHDLPEVRFCPDAPPAERQRFLLFGAALDRARDAEALWQNVAALWAAHRWAFDPAEICRRPLHELAERLRESCVSQRHGLDTVGWRLVAEALLDPSCPAAIRAVLDGQEVDAAAILAGFQATWPRGTQMFPYLSGPKVGPMLVRMLAFPGGARIRGLEAIPVAVDTHVQRASEKLGVVAPSDLEDKHRTAIQRAWFAAVAGGASFGGPPEIDGMAAGLDPALWLLGRNGCKVCETAGKATAVGPVCRHCVLIEGVPLAAEPAAPV